MRNLILAAAAAATLSLGLGTAGADARPLVVLEPAVAPHIVLVGGGCGFGFHRGPYGGCIRSGGYVVRTVVPVYPVLHRACFTRWTAFGARRVCR